MKKKGLLAIIGLVALGIPTTVCAESFTTGIYTYSVNPDGVTVTLTKIEKQRYEQPSLTSISRQGNRISSRLWATVPTK